MTTMLELPEDLVRTIKSRALATGITLDNAVEDILRKSLETDCGQSVLAAVPKTLPHIQARPVLPSNESSMTTQQFCDWIKDFEL